MFQGSTSGAPLLDGGEDSGCDGGGRVAGDAYDDDLGSGELVHVTNINYGQSPIPISETQSFEEAPTNALVLPMENQKFTCVEFSPDWSLVVTATSDGTLSVWDVKNEFVLVGSKWLPQDQRILKRIAFHPFDDEAVLLCFDSGEILRTKLPEFRTADVPGSSQDQGTFRMNPFYECEGRSGSRFDHFTFSSYRTIMVYYNDGGEFASIQFDQPGDHKRIVLSKDFALKQTPNIYVCKQNVLVTASMRSSGELESIGDEIETLFWSELNFEDAGNEHKPARLKGKGFLSNDGMHVLTLALETKDHSQCCLIKVFLAKDAKSNKNFVHVPLATRILTFAISHPRVECLDWKKFNFLNANHEKTKPLIAIHQTNSIGTRIVLWDTNQDEFIYEIDVTLYKGAQTFREATYCFSSDGKWLGVCSFASKMIGLVCARSGVFVWTSYVPQINRADVEFSSLRFDKGGIRLMMSLGKAIYLFEPPSLSTKPQKHPMLHDLYLSQISEHCNNFKILEMAKGWPKQVLFNMFLVVQGMEKEIWKILMDVAISLDSCSLAMICQKHEGQYFLFGVDYTTTSSIEFLWFTVLQGWNQLFLSNDTSLLVKEIVHEGGQKDMSVFYYHDEQTDREQIALFSSKNGIEMQCFDSKLNQLFGWKRLSEQSCFALMQSKDRRLIIALADKQVLIIDLNAKQIIKTVTYSFGLSQWWQSFMDEVNFFGYSRYHGIKRKAFHEEHKLFFQERLRGLFHVSDDGEKILIGWDMERNKSLILTPTKTEEQFRIEWDEAYKSIHQCAMMTEDGNWLGFIDYEKLRDGDIVVCVVDTSNQCQRRVWLGSDESLVKLPSKHKTPFANIFLQMDVNEAKLTFMVLEETKERNKLKQFSIGLGSDGKRTQAHRSLLEIMAQPTNLEKYGKKDHPSTFNTRVANISNFRRVLVEEGEQKAKQFAKDALDNKVKASDIHPLLNDKEHDHMTLLSHAIQKNNTSLVTLCLQFIEDGIFPFHASSGMVKDSFFELLFAYAELFLPILIRNSLKLNVAEVMVPIHVFHCQDDMSNIVFTSDTIFEPCQHFANFTGKRFQESRRKNQHRWKNNKGEAVMKPCYISFHCIANACKVGLDGITRKLLMEEVPDSIFKTMLVRNTINWKWEELWKQRCLHELCWYIVFLLLFTAYAICIGLSGDKLSSEKWVEVVSLVLLLGVIIMAIYFTFIECMQLRTYIEDGKKVFGSYKWGLKHYFRDSQWNLVELSSYFLVLVLIPTFHYLYIYKNYSNKPLFAMVAIESILAWLKIWYYAQPFKRTGALVLLISNVIYDCIPFLILALVVLVGFSIALYVMFQCCLNQSPSENQEDNEDLIHESFGSPQRSLSTLFFAMVGGFEPEVYYNHQCLPWLATLLFILYMALEMIVMLNMLIAVMGDTFDRVKNTEEVQIIIGRARFMDAYEASLTTKQRRDIEKRIGQFLYVLTPKDSEYIRKKSNWKGKINVLEENVKKAIKDTEENVKKAINNNKQEAENTIQERLDKMESILQKTQDEQKKRLEHYMKVIEESTKQEKEHLEKDHDLLLSISQRIADLEVEINRPTSSLSHPATEQA